MWRGRKASTLAADLETRDFMWVVSALAQLFRIPLDAQMVAQAFPPPCDTLRLQAALADLGMQCALRHAEAQRLCKLPMPLVAFRREVSIQPGTPMSAGEGEATEASADAAPGLIPLLVLQADAERLLVISPGDKEPRTLTLAEFGANHVSEIMLVAKREADAAAEEGDDGSTPVAAHKFGFRWFIPHLLKHKQLWRDVIIGSVIIQLIALAMPLTTQVIIDKVVVHQTLNTLWVIAFALVVFLIFNALLT